MSNLIFTANIVAPVFLIIFLGIFLRWRGLLPLDFNSMTSKLVFNVAMPALLFQKLSSIPFSQIFNPKLILFIIAALCVMFGLSWIVSLFFTKNGKDQGTFIQASFRGNFAILGFALINNAFGADALGYAAIVLAFIMPLYNVLSIIGLTVPLHREQSLGLLHTFVTIVTNPLILAAVIALPFSIFQWPVHPVVTQTIDYLAGLTLPLALIGIGSTLSFHSVIGDKRLTAAATAMKIIVVPLICVPTAIWFGFRGQNLGILFFMFAAPSAIASYIMAEALGSNGRLAANIVLVSTIASLFTISLGIFILRTLGYF